jgi:HK97 family phage major capsid protein
MDQALKQAPEMKSADMPSGEVNEAFGDFMHAFEAFKAANDERLNTIERKMTADVVTVDKVDRINRAMDEQKRVMDQLVLKGRRPALGRDGVPGSLASLEHKAAFEAYVRGGNEDALRSIEQKALSVGTPADGGYLVPDETEKEISRRLTAASPIRAISGVRQITGNVYKKPFAITGAATGWTGETDARTTTTSPTLAELEFPAMELYAMPAASATLLDDSATNIDEWIATEVEQAFATQEGTAFVTGDGDKKPTGFLSYTKIAEASWAWTKIGYVITGVSGAFAASNPSDNLVDLVYALKSGYRQNAQWVMNRKTQAAVRKLKDGDGNYIWQPAAIAGGTASLMNFPIAESEDMPDIGANAYSVAFGDFQHGYLIVDRVGVRVLRDPYSAKPYVLFYTTKRVGGGVQDFDAIKLLKFGTS